MGMKTRVFQVFLLTVLYNAAIAQGYVQQNALAPAVQQQAQQAIAAGADPAAVAQRAAQMGVPL